MPPDPQHLVPDTLADLLTERVKADPPGPLLTFYDDAGAERVELSAATTANWVAKTANLLQDVLAVEPGERVAVLLPAHWQAAVVLLACWQVGAEVTDDADEADVAVTDEASVAEARTSGARDVVALSLRPLNQPLSAPLGGVVDYAAEVLAQPDEFVAYAAAAPDQPALRLGDAVWTAPELLAEARDSAAALDRGDRVLTAVPYADLDGLRWGLLGPLAAGASVVLCRHLDEARLPDRVATERVTATVGVDAPGVRRLD